MSEQNFPRKSKEDFNKMLKVLVASGVISAGVAGSITHTAYAAEVKDNESNYIEKDATSTDPSLRHTSIQDLKQLPSYVGSSFVDKFNNLNGDKQNKYEDEPLFDEDNKDKSFLKLSHQDYLHYISANGDNVIVHYISSDGKHLGYSDSNSESDDSNGNSSNSSHAGGFFFYPFMLGGSHYNGASNGVMHSNVGGTTGKDSYSSNPNSKSFKQNSSTVSKNASKASSSMSKSSNSSSSSSSTRSSSSSKGMGSSMSGGARGSSSSAGG